MNEQEVKEITNTKPQQEPNRRKRRLKKDQPDPEWTYVPPQLSEQAQRFLAFFVEQYSPIPEQAFAHFLHEPILRQILFWLEQPQGGPTEEQRQRAGSHETIIHIASHADLLLFGAGTRAQRERVFIELVEGLALMAFVVGGVPRLPSVCEAYNAQLISCAFASFKEAEQSNRRGERVKEIFKETR